MTKFALDTNIVSLILKREKRILSVIDAEVAKGNKYIIPPLVYYEIKRGLLAVDAGVKWELFQALCRKFLVGDMDLSILDMAAARHAQLRRQGRLIEDADILIAAFCIVNNYTLVTDNIRHFERIAGLKYTSLV